MAGVNDRIVRQLVELLADAAGQCFKITSRKVRTAYALFKKHIPAITKCCLAQ